MTISVRFENTERVLHALTPDAYEAKAEQGLIDAAHAIERDAKANLHEHHFRGTTERNTTTSAIERDGDRSWVTVGVHGGQAPQARPLEFGWKSESGKMPPIQPIADWLVSKGYAGPSKGTKATKTADAGVRGLAFVIARNIKRRGFSFGPLHWLGRAYDQNRPKVAGYIERRFR